MARRTPPSRRPMVAGVMAAVLVLGACGSADRDDLTTEAASPDSTATTLADETTTTGASGSESGTTTNGILDVTGRLVGGGEIDLAAYGDRPLLLWFWAPF